MSHTTFLPALGLLAALVAALPAHADDAPWLRCRAVTDPAARLACYDAVQPQPAAAAAPTAAATAAAAAADRFGKDTRRPDEVDQIRSALPGRFEGWDPGQRFRLANGQVWQATDGSRGAYNLDSPKVLVRRGAFGSYLLEIEGVSQVIRVRRIQ